MEPTIEPTMEPTMNPLTFVHSFRLSLEGSFADLQSYLTSQSKTCSEWAIPVIQTTMRANEFSALLEISIAVNGCSAGSILLDFEIEHSNEGVLEMAATYLNSAATVLDEERGLRMNVLGFYEVSASTTTTTPSGAPSASPSFIDLDSSSSLTTSSFET